MNSLIKKPQHPVLKFIIVITVIILAFKLFANIVASTTTKVLQNPYNDSLIGRYIERDENHRSFPNAAMIKIKQITYYGERSHYLVLSYISHDAKDRVHILFESFRIRNIFTPKRDKTYGFDGVLKPIHFLKSADFEDFLNVDDYIIRDANAPKGCEFRTYNDSFGPALGYGWRSTRDCKSKHAQFYINGYFSRSGEAFRVKLNIRSDHTIIQVGTRHNNSVHFRKNILN